MVLVLEHAVINSVEPPSRAGRELFRRHSATGGGGVTMSEERILLKFIVGQRVVKQGEDSRFEGEVVACFVKRDHKTVR